MISLIPTLRPHRTHSNISPLLTCNFFSLTVRNLSLIIDNLLTKLFSLSLHVKLFRNGYPYPCKKQKFQLEYRVRFPLYTVYVQYIVKMLSFSTGVSRSDSSQTHFLTKIFRPVYFFPSPPAGLCRSSVIKVNSLAAAYIESSFLPTVLAECFHFAYGKSDSLLV